MTIVNTLTRVSLAIAGIIAALTMTGCWDDAEINGRAFVLGFGADSGGEEYRFTFQLAIPVSGESDSSGSIQYTSRCVAEPTPASAVRRLEKDLGRQINFEQLSLIVIGGELSKKGFAGLTDYFFQRASVRRQSCIAVCSGSAEAFFGSSATDKAISTEAASALQSYDAGSGHIAMNLFSLYKILINRDEFFLPKMAALPENSGDSSAGESGKAMLTLSGASAYGRDGQFLGDISEEELELLWLTRGGGTGGSLNVKDGSGNGYCCQIRQSDCSVKCAISDGAPVFRIKLELVIVPLDAQGRDDVGYSEEVQPMIAVSAENTVKARLEALAVRSRETLGSSVLGLQDILRQRQPDWYALHEKEWESIYPESDIIITVNCTAAGGGITK